MRTLLLAAKFIAIQERKEFISIDLVKIAWHCLEPIDGDLDQHLLNIIRSQISQIQLVNDYLLAKYQQRLTLSDLNSASEHERILFDSGLKEFIEKLPAPQYSSSKSASLFTAFSMTHSIMCTLMSAFG